MSKRPTRVPKNARAYDPKRIRILKHPRDCGLCDMDRASRNRLPSCKRDAWFTVPEILFGMPWRLAVCRHHLTAPARCYAVLVRPKGRRERCRRRVSGKPWRCPQHPIEKSYAL